jgi:uncharacterized membrane protein YphA (DoxX/SURF4 family)
MWRSAEKALRCDCGIIVGFETYSRSEWMDGLIRVGRLLYAVAFIVFGIQCLAAGAGKKFLLPSVGPPWVQTEHGLALLVGLGMILMAILLIQPRYMRIVANLLGILILLRAALVGIPQIMARLHDPRPWTSTFELVALGSAALVIAGTAGPLRRERRMGRRVDPQSLLVELGRWLFAISLVVFGVQHLMYPGFVASLITPWIPAHLFWAYATGIAFILAAASLLVKRKVLLAGGLLGLMFLLWVIVLHIPRVMRAPLNGNEWTSEFVALAMSGASFVIAGVFSSRS